MASVSKLRRVLMTGGLAVVVASGALYGASLKIKQESMQQAQKNRSLTPQEKIDALTAVRESLVKKKETIEEQIREIEERSIKRDENGIGRDGDRGRTLKRS